MLMKYICLKYLYIFYKHIIFNIIYNVNTYLKNFKNSADSSGQDGV